MTRSVAKNVTIDIQLESLTKMAERKVSRQKNSPIMARAPYGFNVQVARLCNMKIWKIQLWITIAAQIARLDSTKDSVVNPVPSGNTKIKTIKPVVNPIATPALPSMMLRRPVPNAAVANIKIKTIKPVARIARLDSTRIKITRQAAKVAGEGSTRIKTLRQVVKVVEKENTMIKRNAQQRLSAKIVEKENTMI